MSDELITQFNIKVSRNNYIILMRKKHELFNDLKNQDVIRNISFDDVITDMLLKDMKN